MLAGIVSGVIASALAASVLGQTPNPPDTLKFQVATIKPADPEETRGMLVRGNRFETFGTTVVDLLKYAYGIHDQEIVNAPKRFKTQKFHILADPETQTRPSSDEFKKMLQNLLADRFHLAAHHEMRELSVFEIVPAKGGPKLTRSTRPPGQIPGVGYEPGELSASNASMADLATFLQRFVSDRPVFDGTGITGKYDFTLRWMPDAAQAEASRRGDDKSLPGFYTAIQEQLGLKLQAEKRRAQVLVVDHAEMPTEN